MVIGEGVRMNIVMLNSKIVSGEGGEEEGGRERDRGRGNICEHAPSSATALLRHIRTCVSRMPCTQHTCTRAWKPCMRRFRSSERLATASS